MVTLVPPAKMPRSGEIDFIEGGSWVELWLGWLFSELSGQAQKRHAPKSSKVAERQRQVF